MFLSTNNKCSLTNESFYAVNMKLSGDSLLICGDLRFSGRPQTRSLFAKPGFRVSRNTASAPDIALCVQSYLDT